jgi:hypothetical protein
MEPGEGHLDFNVYLGQTYRYTARGRNADGVEGPASPVVTMTAVDNSIPNPPANLVVTGSDSTLTVTWDHPASPDVQGYHAYLSLYSGGPYTRANTTLIPNDRTTYSAHNLQNGTQYYLVMRALDFAGNESVDSVEVSGTPGP